MKNETLEYIRNSLTKEDLLLQLAEECAELGKAGLKMARVLIGRNPTPIKRPEAFNNLIEEYADVLLCMEVLGMETEEVYSMIREIQAEKLARWKQRIEANTDYNHT